MKRIIIFLFIPFALSVADAQDMQKFREFQARQAAEHQAQAAAQERARIDPAQQWKLRESLENITYGVITEVTGIRKNEIEARITVGGKSSYNEPAGLDVTVHHMWLFTDATYCPDKQRMEERVTAADNKRAVQDLQIWGVVQDYPTGSAFSGQRIFMEVYLIGAAETKRNQRYRLFTASRDRAIAYLRDQNNSAARQQIRDLFK